VQVTTRRCFSRLYVFIGKIWKKLVPIEIQTYYNSLFPQQRIQSVNINKPGGVDFYLFLFLVELACAIYILCVYDNMATSSLNSTTSMLSNSLFSGDMVITLFIQILFIILDRTVYLYRSLMCKIILQYITLLYWHIHIFFTWVKKTKKNKNQNMLDEPILTTGRSTYIERYNKSLFSFLFFF
jgi:hypothetical protein